MKAWRVVRYGRPTEALSMEDLPVPEPGPNELLVRVAASVLNYNEVDGCHGRYLTVNPPIPYTLGMEVAGVVEAAGPGAEAWAGRRMVASAVNATGAHAEYMLARPDMAFEAPASLDDIGAAAFFFPFHLAHLGLFERGRLQAGESVLIHAGAGGVGSAAVQLAAATGARVFATAGGETKTALCRELGADVAIDYRSTDFAEAVNEATGGKGVDLVFDGVGLTDDSLHCLGYNGRYRLIGLSSGIEAEEEKFITPRTIFFGNFSVGGVLLSYNSNPEEARRLRGFNVTPRSVGDAVQSHLLALLAAGKIRPVIGDVVPFAQLPQALNDMEDRKTTGRVVVRAHSTG